MWLSHSDPIAMDHVHNFQGLPQAALYCFHLTICCMASCYGSTVYVQIEVQASISIQPALTRPLFEPVFYTDIYGIYIYNV